jgi:LacI family transcriptional regulator
LSCTQKMKETKTIILLIETTHSYGRGLLQGIAKYAKHHGPFTFYREAPFYGGSSRSKLYSRLKRLNADGIIVREPKNLKEIQDLNIPAIISPTRLDSNIPAIITDAETIGLYAAEHFLKRGFRNFAFCGFNDMPWSVNRNAGFTRIIEKSGFHVDTFNCTVSDMSTLSSKTRNRLIVWLNSLAKPVGLMTCNDDMGRVILEACKISTLSVPGQIAVVGVDNDDLICDFTDPPLSSVALDSQKAGYDAAKLLDRLMHGEKMNGQVIQHLPSNVVTRLSSDILAINDTDVSEAICFIRQHYKKPITENEVAQAVALSRRHLYKKFMETLGHSVHKEIKNVRIEHICKLLIETDLSISQITQTMEFANMEHLSRYFRKEKGMSPQEFRKKVRLHS